MASTREKILSLLDDMELLTGELVGNLIGSKSKRLDMKEVLALLTEKQISLKEAVVLAEEQGEIEKEISCVAEEVKKEEAHIKTLQKHLKEAETVLSTAIYQSRQKLEAIEKANQNPVQSEDLIKYAHRISASNAVSAPLNWVQGDPRRPYPTDMEMRVGVLARPDLPLPMGGRMDFPHQSPSTPHHHHNTPHHHSQHHMGGSAPGTPMSGMMNSPKMVPPGPHSIGASGPGFSWQGGDMTLNMRDGSSVHVETKVSHDRTGGDEVEAMSTDSSSSSSTDSN